MSTALKWIVRIFGVLIGVLLIIFLVASAIPAKADPNVGDNHGAGASSVQPSYTGLQREFPALNETAANPTTDAKAELGYLLFFDPILSENNDIACATCHQPDLGFADGLELAIGADGTVLSRNTPGLWNVGYAQNLFWDGRLDSLEAQSEIPLTHPDEMGVIDTDALVAEVAAISDYATMFDAAFEDGVTLINIENALAAFQRTLITNNSPFDQYAAGNVDALTPSQRRGLALFRSGATRCFECHTAPTFANDTFRVVGVPSEDPGRAAISEDGATGAFKVPSLRNIALTAPYMHNGSLETLEDVVDFYADGGGRLHGQENVDVFVQGFDLTDQERLDLVAFLYALTDESGIPAVPTAVPSGLPVISPTENPARAEVAAHNVGGNTGIDLGDREPMTIVVQEGESVQTAVDRARPGDIIEIPYGIYHERVVVDINNITLRGIPNEAGEWPIFDGEGKLTEAVIASGNNFTVGNLHVRNYTDNGVLVEGVTGVHFHDIFAENVGTYGVYPVRSTDVLIERVEVTGVDDAGVYAGQCENVIVRDSVVYGNVLGIELENTINGEIYSNHAYDNTVGIFVVLLPQLTSKISANTLVYDNIVEDNNHENFAPPGAIAGIAPSGVGILLLATDNAEVYNNEIRNNKTTGVAVFSLTSTGAFDTNEVDVGPLPENNWVHDNIYENNGYDADPFVRDLGIPTADILWDGTGMNNRFNEESASSFPPLVPGDGWPSFVQRGYTNILGFLVSQLL
ncbi:parallel beta-helix domain-containing protein [Candidatus Leptofilum sp.]|uniref:parallel beta-helix domain-containing protein n=1 Tax=Candidatus Leptofilum sp. TaxID=3241576 RepID=UPI003B5CCE24